MLYFDQAATAFPKAPGVSDAVKAYLDSCGMNVGRGAYQAASRAETMVLDAREGLCELFRHPDPSLAIFTSGQTAALNTVLMGFLRPGDRCVVSSMEHNAVMRPLSALTKRGVIVEQIPCSPEGEMDLQEAERLILYPGVRLVLVTHASNVCGTLLPVEALSRICLGAGVPLALDAAQTAGHVPIDFETLHLSALCVPGHKGLLGPQGIGALLMSREFAAQLSPLTMGGTGSASDKEIQPEFLPDKFESGTLNLPGIAGLGAAIRFILDTGVEILGESETELTKQFLNGIRDIPGVCLMGKQNAQGRVGVISLNFEKLDNAAAAYRLDAEFGIQTRCGLHCAPSAHRTMGTFPRGTVRFSLGYGNTAGQVAAALEAIKAVSKG